jgi:hypothetical protein
MVLHATYTKGNKPQRVLPLPVRVFVRILLIHAVVMYLCAWVVNHKRTQLRLSHRVPRTPERVRVAALPVIPTRAGPRAVWQ